MTKRTHRPTLEDRRRAFHARHPRLVARENRDLPADARPSEMIILGADDNQRLIKIEDRARCEHMHVIGATGCGKSTFLLNCILQDIMRGRGVCVLDPHGGHPDSLLNMVLRFLSDHQWFAGRQVHIIAPNVREHVVGLNPLGPLPNTDSAVIAGAMLEAFSRVWGDENIDQKPTTQRILHNTFTALAESGLPLAEAADLLSYEDRRGLRQELIRKLKNEIAKGEVERIERLSKQPRGLVDFEANVLGPVNRLAKFLACDAIRLMFSMTAEGNKPARTIDLLDIMNRGQILLVDLQHGGAVDEAATDLLGKIVLRYLFMLMTHRKPYLLPGSTERKFRPFFVYVDEAHRYMTDDVEGLLTQSRKFGIGVTLAHQYLAQLGKPGDKIYEAVRNSTETKVVFRVKSPEEAQALAYDVLPLTLELPVQASVRPTQVGYTIGKLASESYSVHEGEGESEAVHAAEAISQGRTDMQTWMSAQSRTSGSSLGSGSAASLGRGFSEGASNTIASMESMSFSYDPNTQTFLAVNLPLGMNIGTADSTSQSLISSKNFQSAESLSRFQALTETEGRTDAEGGGIAMTKALTTSRGKSLAKSKTRGKSQSQGASEAVMPLYADLPTSFHSKDNELYIKGEMIRGLPIGRAVIKFRGNITFLSVPPPRKSR